MSAGFERWRDWELRGLMDGLGVALLGGLRRFEQNSCWV